MGDFNNALLSQLEKLNKQIEMLLKSTNKDMHQVPKTTSELKIDDMPFTPRTKINLIMSRILMVDDLLAFENFDKIYIIRGVGIVVIRDIIRTMREMGFGDWVQQALENTDLDLREKIQKGLKCDE